MDYFAMFLLGMLAAAMLIRYMARRAIENIVQRLDQPRSPSQPASLPVKLEFAQNVFLLYNSDSGAFVAQGADLPALVQNVTRRYPDSKIHIVDGDNEAIEKLRSQLKQHENSNSIRSTP